MVFWILIPFILCSIILILLSILAALLVCIWCFYWLDALILDLIGCCCCPLLLLHSVCVSLYTNFYIFLILDYWNLAVFLSIFPWCGVFPNLLTSIYALRLLRVERKKANCKGMMQESSKGSFIFRMSTIFGRKGYIVRQKVYKV